MKNIELRNMKHELTGDDSSGLKITGHIPTDSWSQVLGSNKKFVERILPGTFTRALQSGNDVHFLAEHDKDMILSSTKNGSLILREDDTGLSVEARISATSYGKDYHVLISEGLIQGLSFGMTVKGDKWEKRSDGIYQRSISEIHLAEISAVKNPAYNDTTVKAFENRGIEVVTDPEINLTNTKSEAPNMATEKQLKELRQQVATMESKLGVVSQNTEQRTVSLATIENDKQDFEERGMEQFLKGDIHSAEVRTLTTGSQSITVPTHLSNIIIEKLVEEAALFGRAKSFRPTSGTLEVLREQNIGGATFIGELENAEKADFTFDKIVLEQRRAATAIELSQQLVNDSGINVINYSVGVMTRRLAREMDKSVLIGDKNAKQFEGILTTTKAEEIGSGVTVELDDLLDMTLDMHPDYLSGSVFVVSRATFNQIAKLKDNNGQYHLIRDVVNGKPGYKILGHEILIQDHMTGAVIGEVSVAFVNFEFAYATMVKKGASMKRISDDTANALKGTQLLMLDVYADGKILNEDAIKFFRKA